MHKKVYILSTGRAGTSFLSNIIHKESGMNVHQDKISRVLNIFANISLVSPYARAILTKHLNNQFGELPPATLDPLKTSAYMQYLNNLKQKNPKEFYAATIIHLVRDPRDFVTSFMNWKNRKISGLVAHHLVPFWMPKPSNIGFFKNLFMDKFEHFSWVWYIKNKFIYESFSQYDNYRLYRFEDITSDIKSLNSLVEDIMKEPADIDYRYLSYKVNKSNNKKFPEWPEWSVERASLLDSICGGLMKQFNYGNEQEWLNKLHQDE